MTKKQKLIQKLLSGSKNVRFSDVQTAVERLVFSSPAFAVVTIYRTYPENIFVVCAAAAPPHTQQKKIYFRIGSYAHPDVPELLNLQEVNGKAKPYQIKQFFLKSLKGIICI
jgi:hypothetical protein